MRIALIGQSAFGEAVLKALIERGEQVVGVFCPPDAEGRRPDPITTAAKEASVPLFQFSRMRDDEAIAAFAGLSADLCVMAYVTDIVPDEILQDPRLGTIQYHPSLLPLHRGPSSINWAIIHGDDKTGLTIFWPDEGLDTGPVLLQKTVDIGPDDTTGSLYFDKLFALGVEAMVVSVGMVRDGNAPRTEQDHSLATYESWCKASDVTIDWARPVGDLHNLIRGSDPSPGSGTTLNGAEVRFFKTSKQEADTGRPAGEVVSVDGEGFVVAANGGSLRVRRVKPAGQKKLASAEWAAAVGLKPGDLFGGQGA
jgi:methionyl-tRNA formyltransferase